MLFHPVTFSPKVFVMVGEISYGDVNGAGFKVCNGLQWLVCDLFNIWLLDYNVYQSLTHKQMFISEDVFTQYV